MATPFAISQLAKKLRLEANFNPKLTKFFKSIGRTISPVMKSTGQIPSMAPFRQDLIELLTRHYDRVANAFTGDTVETLTKGWDINLEYKQETIQDIADEQSEILDEALLGIIALRAPRQADFILETTEKELNQALDKSIIDAAAEGKTLTRAQQARKVSEDFNSKMPGRVSGISENETGAMAEETKFTEAQVISSAIGAFVTIAMRKTWHTILDEVTRPAHVRADLQVRTMPLPFIVNGQQLKHPKDMSLGASLSNVMNCRCSMEITSDAKPVTETDMFIDPEKIVIPKPKPTSKPTAKPKVSKRQKLKPRLPDKKVTVKPIKVDEFSDIESKISGMISETEKRSLRRYTGDGYKEYRNSKINPSLFTPDEKARLNRLSKSLNSAINKSTIEESASVYRGMNSPELKDMILKGKIKKLNVKSIQSTSKSAAVAKNFSDKDGIVFKINVKKGTKALDVNKVVLGKNRGEFEILLPDRGEMIVKNIEEDAFVGGVKRLVVEMDYVQ